MNRRNELRVEIQSARSELKSEIQGVRTELQELRHELKQLEQRMTIRLGTIVTAAMAALAVLIKFF